MEVIALLSNSDELIIPNVKGALKKYSVYPLKTLEELKELYSNIPLNLFLIDTTSQNLSHVIDFIRSLDRNLVVLIMPDKPDKFGMDNLPESVFDCVEVDAIRTELPVIIERVLERQRLKNEISLLKQSRELSDPVRMQVLHRPEVDAYSGRIDPLPGGKYIQEKVIVNFARMLSVSFDMRKLLSHFIDSVMEIARVSKMSIMLRDNDGFYMKTHCGLDPCIADNLKMRKDCALATWLTKTGRIMHKPTSFHDSSAISIKSEMEAIQCSVSFPMIYKGKLIGIFNIDSKITEEPFYREELEIIYVLCNYLAAAVKDIDLYHQMWYQKEFTKNILSSMSSGMIAIDRSEKITVFNQQASDILNLDPSRMVGSDIRSLPSPLGDLLYETMETGISYTRHEVTINPDKLPLGINSYRLLDEHRNPVGAGIVFSDLSDSKQLDEQLRKAEKLEAVNDLMAKIAHEVRNPLTSIQTYTQLLHDKQDDDDLNKFYVSTVSQSIKRLDSLIDKLVTFSSTADYNLQKIDVNLVLNEAADFISKRIPGAHKFLNNLADKTLYINADVKHLVKALYYIVLSIVERTQDGTLIYMNADTIIREVIYIEVSLTFKGSEFIREDRQQMIKPLLDINDLGAELNLPISHKIIEGHHGSIDLKSEGDTSTYLIRLPVIDRRSSQESFEGGHYSGT